MVEVTGASGVVNIPLSKFVYKSNEKPEPNPEPTPVPKTEDSKPSSWGTLTIVAIVAVVLVVGGLAFVMIRRSMAKGGFETTTNELDALERSGEYSSHQTRDEDSIHLKKD